VNVALILKFTEIAIRLGVTGPLFASSGLLRRARNRLVAWTTRRHVHEKHSSQGSEHIADVSPHEAAHQSLAAPGSA